MLRILSDLKVDFANRVLQKHIQFDVPLATVDPSDLPTHILAIASPHLKTSQPQRTTLYLTHETILVAYCAHLSTLPSSRIMEPNANPTRLILPVHSLRIPCPQTYPQLIKYLYTKDTQLLLASILPIKPFSSMPNPADRLRLSVALARAFTSRTLLQYAMMVNGIWRNTCALGIFDDGLWAVMDAAWDIIISALSMASVGRHG